MSIQKPLEIIRNSVLITFCEGKGMGDFGSEILYAALYYSKQTWEARTSIGVNTT
jgi:hypothetical protein